MKMKATKRQSQNNAKNHFTHGSTEQLFEDMEPPNPHYCTPVRTTTTSDKHGVPKTPDAPRRDRRGTENYISETDFWTPSHHRRNRETSLNSGRDLSPRNQINFHTIQKQSLNDKDENISTLYVVRELEFFATDSIFNFNCSVQCECQNAIFTSRHRGNDVLEGQTSQVEVVPTSNRKED